MIGIAQAVYYGHWILFRRPTGKKGLGAGGSAYYPVGGGYTGGSLAIKPGERWREQIEQCSKLRTVQA